MVDHGTLQHTKSTKENKQEFPEPSQEKNPRPETTNIVQQLNAKYQHEMRKAKAIAWKHFCTEEFNEDPYKAIKKLPVNFKLKKKSR